MGPYLHGDIYMANPWSISTKQERDEMFARAIWMNAVVIPSVSFVRFLEQCIAGDIALGPVLGESISCDYSRHIHLSRGSAGVFKHMIRGNGSCRSNHYACVIVGFLLLAIIAIWL